MRKKSMSQFGYFNPRICIALLLCLDGVSMVVLSFAKPVRSTALSPVIVTEFSDFQCPYCKRAADVIDQVRKAYGERVKVVFKQMPLQMHEYAFQAARASVCAGEQGKFWDYHDRLFASEDLSPDALKGIAAEVGLKQDPFNQCMVSETSRRAVEKDMVEAKRLGVRGTPTFLVNGKAIRGATSFAALKQAIDGAALRPNDAAMAAIRRPQDVWQRLKGRLGATLGLVQQRVPAQAANAGDALEVRSHRPRAVTSVTTGGVTLSPASIDFGYQLIGTTGQPVTETVTNSGTGPLVITDISVSGRDHRNFIPTYNFSLPVTVAPGNSIVINLAFTPSSPWRAGTRDARLEISERRNSQYISLTGIGATCLGPLPACSSGCPDTDGDGLNDAWEVAGGIDLDNDGVIDATKGDLLLPGANPNRPDIYVWYDWMDYSLDGQSCGTDSDCYPDSGIYHLRETCNVAQGQCVYSCSTDSDCTSRRPTEAHAGERCVNNICEHTHDPLAADANVFQPVIERFAAHGINLHILRGNAQPHSHVLSYRSDAQMTANCEGATGQNVGLGRYAVSFSDLEPRSNPDKLNLAYHYVVFAHYSGCDSGAHCPASSYFSDCQDPTLSFGQAGDAYRSGNDFIVSLGSLVNDSGLSLRWQTAGTFMHELGHNLGLRHDGHLDTPCRTNTDCASGDTCTDIYDGQGRVCHEIFNGLVGTEEPNYKPNYLSVMNYMYETSFIQIGPSVGSRVPRRCTSNADCGGNGAICVFGNNPFDTVNICSVSAHVCNSDSDCPITGESCLVRPNTCSTTGYVCVTDSDCTGGDTCLPPSPGYCARIDYSSQTLPIGGNTPGALDEANLDDTVGLGSGTADLFNYWTARCLSCPLTAPTNGPVDWSGNGVWTDYQRCGLHLTGVESFTDRGVQADVDWAYNGACGEPPWDLLHGHTDWPDLSGIAFNYKFQCTPNGSQ